MYTTGGLRILSKDGLDKTQAELHFVTITAMTEIKSYDVLRNSITNEEISRRDLGVADYELVISNWGERQTIPSLKRMWASSDPRVDALRTALPIPNTMLGFASVSLAHFRVVKQQRF